MSIDEQLEANAQHKEFYTWVSQNINVGGGWRQCIKQKLNTTFNIRPSEGDWKDWLSMYKDDVEVLLNVVNKSILKKHLSK